MAKEARLTFRIDNDVHDKLRLLARDDRRTIVDYVRIVLQDHVRKMPIPAVDRPRARTPNA